MRRAVGIFFFLGLILLGAMTFWVDKEISLFRHGESFYYIRLDNASGLQEGARVWLAGVDAGRITKITLLPDQVGIRAEFVLFKGYRLRQDSQASLPPTSLLANGRMLELSLGSPASPYLPMESEPPGIEVKDVKPPVALEQVVEKADQLFAGLKDAAPAIKQAAESIRNITAKIDKGEGALAKFLNDPKLYDDLRAAVGKLDEGLGSFKSITAKLDKGEGTLGKLVADEGLYVEARRLLKEAREAVEDAREQAPITAFSSVIFAAFQ